MSKNLNQFRLLDLVLKWRKLKMVTSNLVKKGCGEELLDGLFTCDFQVDKSVLHSMFDQDQNLFYEIYPLVKDLPGIEDYVNFIENGIDVDQFLKSKWETYNSGWSKGGGWENRSRNAICGSSYVSHGSDSTCYWVIKDGSVELIVQRRIITPTVKYVEGYEFSRSGYFSCSLGGLKLIVDGLCVEKETWGKNRLTGKKERFTKMHPRKECYLRDYFLEKSKELQL